MADTVRLRKQYDELIRSLSPVSFDGIRKIASSILRENYSESDRSHLWEALDHGRAVIDKEELLWQYLHSFGRMHQDKMRIALDKLRAVDKICESPIHIIDWGCGQGLATVCFFDYAAESGVKAEIDQVTLIEPSAFALSNAALHVGAYGITSMKCVQKLLDDVQDDDLKSDAEVTVHLFSNILDVTGFDLKRLASLIARNARGTHYFVCVSPYYGDSRRIEHFKNYFVNTKHLKHQRTGYSGVNVVAQQTKQEKGEESFTMELLLFEYVTGESSVIQVDYYPPVQFFAGYELDFIGRRRINSQKAKDKAIKNMIAHDMAAPFDLGALVYADVNPVLAVLNNILVRGLPTKASPFIEEVFSFAGNKLLADDLGRIAYSGQVSDDRPTWQAQYYSPIGAAWVQKALLEALICERLPLDQPSWKILVRENDVPCAALAIEDFKKTFGHLVALTRDYQHMKLPEIELHIITSSDYVESPLHLDADASLEPNQSLKNTAFDMVIEIAVTKALSDIQNDFSDFNCKNDCYFAIGRASDARTSRYLYTSDQITYIPLGRTSAEGTFRPDEEAEKHLRYFINLLFRKQDFRPGQIPILNRALQGKNVIGLLPTGGGKSLTYQLAAIMQPGVTIVVDPLKSLMKDQYDGLLAAGIDTCAFINSSLSAKQKRACEEMMEQSQLQFVFLTPERLCSYEFRRKLKTMHELRVYFAYGVIDEVHCVSEWGHDFRFSYLHLGRNLYNYVKPKTGHLVLFGLTATASFDVLADVERELSGEGAYQLDSNTVVRYENADRLELQYRVRRVPLKFLEEGKAIHTRQGQIKARRINAFDAYKQKQAFLHEAITEVPKDIKDLQSDHALDVIRKRFESRQNTKSDTNGIELRVAMPQDMFAKAESYPQAGIVFCPHRDNTGVSVYKNEQSLADVASNIGTFVGGSDEKYSDEKSFRNLSLFKDDRQPLMIATKAFGMGIDKPNIRFTVNMNYSSSLEGFVQEAGRAGRDRKLAVANILVSDYRLYGIDQRYENNAWPFAALKGKWFVAEDFRAILEGADQTIPSQFIREATPEKDWVRLKCPEKNLQKNFDNKTCAEKCPEYAQCRLARVPDKARGWLLERDLRTILDESRLAVKSESFEYLNPDYGCNMFFYGENFKGASFEKRALYTVFCKTETEVFVGDSCEFKKTKVVGNLMDEVLSLEEGEELVAYVSYEDTDAIKGSDVQKAVYRMCCIGFIDDFTQSYSPKKLRVVMRKKSSADYEAALKRYLERYYTETRALELIRSVSDYEGQNEVQKYLAFLTEFIYEKIAVKRKRAIDDMRAFCMQGADESKDWKDANEDLKDYIYYYFNSKYANDDYRVDDKPYALTVDTDRGKLCTPDTVFKYMRVVDDELIEGGTTPIDNVKHLQGAVRLIRRSLTDSNPVLTLLNCFCLIQLGTSGNEALEQEVLSDYKQGLLDMADRLPAKDYWAFFDRFHAELEKRPGRYDVNNLLWRQEEMIAQTHLMRLKEITNGFLGGLITRSDNE